MDDHRLPIDSDVDLHDPAQRAELHAPTLAVIALGGVLGACARYLLGLAFPAPHNGFPLVTFGINLLGCVLLGALMVVVTELRTPHPLVRPFLGVGVLGGFTTFSTYAVDVVALVRAHHVATAVLYLTGTLLGALAAVWLGIAVARRLEP